MEKDNTIKTEDFRWQDIPKAIWYFLEEDKKKFFRNCYFWMKPKRKQFL